MKPTLTLAAAILVFAASVAFAQPPQASPAQPPAKDQRAPRPASGGRNLQVLPADIPQRNLMNTMQAFTRALGVQCSHCHVPGNFASDDNPHKQVAREMMRMTARLNNEILPAIRGLHSTRVSCFTCHRGAATPLTQPGESAPAPHGHDKQG